MYEQRFLFLSVEAEAPGPEAIRVKKLLPMNPFFCKKQQIEIEIIISSLSISVCWAHFGSDSKLFKGKCFMWSLRETYIQPFLRFDNFRSEITFCCFDVCIWNCYGMESKKRSINFPSPMFNIQSFGRCWKTFIGF